MDREEKLREKKNTKTSSERQETAERKREKKIPFFLKVVLIVLTVILVLCIGVVIYIQSNYKLDKVQVVGNVHPGADNRHFLQGKKHEQYSCVLF